MSLKKVNYVAEETVITADNLNDIQDNIIINAETNNNLSSQISAANNNHS